MVRARDVTWSFVHDVRIRHPLGHDDETALHRRAPKDPVAETQPPHERVDDLDAAVARNRATARNLALVHASVVAGLVALVLGIALALGGGPIVVALLVAVVAGPLATWAVARGAQARVLDAVGARPERADDGLARVHNLIEALSVSVGVSEPELRVVDDPGANLMSVWGWGRDPVLVVTSGLTSHADRLALEGLLAHELSHIRRADHLVTTLAAALAGAPALAATRRNGPGAWIGGAFAPLAGAVARSAVGHRREHLADLTAIRHTRYPPGLIAGLTAVARSGPGPSGAPPATWPMWLASPAPSGPPAPHHVFDTHPPISERLEALAEL